uniref:Uncharacterized protein n=1 Tax=Arundo donax TaxID=35708 RepID=A0A0A8Y4K8_ARUDO
MQVYLGSVWHCGGFSKVLIYFYFLGAIVSWKHLFGVYNSKNHTRNGKYSPNYLDSIVQHNTTQQPQTEP